MEYFENFGMCASPSLKLVKMVSASEIIWCLSNVCQLKLQDSISIIKMGGGGGRRIPKKKKKQLAKHTFNHLKHRYLKIPFNMIVRKCIKMLKF